MYSICTSFSAWDQGLYLAHHGTKGQKWGLRRYQNPDGSLTPLGQKHYSSKLRKVYGSGKNGLASSEKSVKKKYKNAAYKKVLENTSGEREALRSAIRERESIESDYWSNKRAVNKYQKKAAKKTAKQMGADYKDVLNDYRKGDFDQGEGSSYNEYLRKNKKAADRYVSSTVKMTKALVSYSAKVSSEVDSVLGKYGKKKVKNISPASINGAKKKVSKRTLKDVMVSDLVSLGYSDSDYPSYLPRRYRKRD